MTAPTTDHQSARPLPAPSVSPPRVAAVRAAAALVWAAALVLALGGAELQAGTEVPVAAAALLASYPLIDVVATALTVARADGVERVTRANLAVSSLAVVVIAAAAFGFDAGTTLVAFGGWAALSGALQFTVALRARRDGRQLPMLISGGLSTVAGLSFIAAGTGTEADLATLAGYMTVGALLSLIWAYRTSRAG
ncbi:MAG: hypothetical protein Q7T55_12185 [Solirubrobacteraceae bacterium]|nr:hypothetical protein [Solirubrobacteraceae bacterium]